MSTSHHTGHTSKHFTAGDTSGKAADPYTKANTEDLNLSLKDKVEDLMGFCEGMKFGMMTTRQDQSGLLVSRCMGLAAKENGVDLIFHTNTETGKTDELLSDPHANMAFIKPSTGEWASISGTASVTTDRDIVRKYYSPSLKAWIGDLGDGVHDGGPEDPRIAIIKIRAISATYALAKGSAVSRGIEIAKGALTGHPAHTIKLREITEGELEQYRAVN
ncbi:putative BLI-3 blue-light-inducible Bli-3 protein [Sphaerosporella brunnea]|uniref:Putative BLI-3 blue-light-inducible Bli-3 protein n=1 Tax=Sphaerosporella brunnea TaxID=1250544 RepID=A0A5J5FBZ6_9PEZI|nr:putative BLI-3 blue-light-inducible Bli-3 protein [Sphaerosporella brunnea]